MPENWLSKNITSASKMMKNVANVKRDIHFFFFGEHYHRTITLFIGKEKEE